MLRPIVVLIALLTLSGASAAADPYPTRPIRLVVAFAPGGAADIIGRALAQQLTEQLGQSVIVDNRPGAGGAIGYDIVAKSKPDGYTLLLVDTSIAVLPGLRKSLPYDVDKDFTPITGVVNIPSILVVNPSLGIRSFDAFLAYARANPGKLNYGSGGIGSSGQLFAELFKTSAAVDIAHIPYKGGGEMVTALLGGQVQMVLISVPSVLEHVKGGRLAGLAVTTSQKRVATLPDVPSMSESGLFKEGVYNWYGVAGPAGLPRDIVDKLRIETVKAIESAGVREKLVAQGAELVGSTPEEFGASMRRDVKRWTEVIKALGIPASD